MNTISLSVYSITLYKRFKIKIWKTYLVLIMERTF